MEEKKITLKDLMDNPIVKIHRNIEHNKTKIHPRDFVFFNVDMIERAAKHSIKFKQCEQCKQNLEELVRLSEQFPELLETIQGRKQFGKRLDKVIVHLRKAHKIFPQGYFKAVYSLYGTVLGFILAIIVYKLKLLSLYMSVVIVLGVVLVIAYFYGAYRDGQVKKQNQQL